MTCSTHTLYLAKDKIQENEQRSIWLLYRELTLEEVVHLDYMMSTASSTETSVTEYHSTKRHIPEDGNLQHCAITSKACSIIHYYFIPFTYSATYLVCAQPFIPRTKHNCMVGIKIKTKITFKMSIQYLMQNVKIITCWKWTFLIPKFTFSTSITCMNNYDILAFQSNLLCHTDENACTWTGLTCFTSFIRIMNK